MNDTLQKLEGKKTYIAALGMALLGVVDLLNGDTIGGIQKLMEAAALAGLRHGVATSK